MVLLRLLIVFLIVVFNALRWVGLNFSPPGFNVDEAAGAAQVLCIQQTGHDFFSHHFPFFAEGIGGGGYTGPYLYGEVLWTSIFGSSIGSFRSFLALLTSLTILFLYRWVRRRAGERVALYAALSASIMPWAFQFSRIANDLPLFVLFLVMALWASDLHFRGRKIGLFAFVPLVVFLGASIPFVGRLKVLVLWSDYSINPYLNANGFDLFAGFVKQLLEHFSSAFLFWKGDANLQRSIGTVGMLSWLDDVAVLGALVFLIRSGAWSNAEKTLLKISLVGIVIGVLPSALTWEAVPHAGRSIAAWPFFAVFTGLMLSKLEQLFKNSRIPAAGFLVVAVGFFSFYLCHYFTDYPVRAQPYFQSENAPLAQAYHRMTVEGRSCEDIRN